MIQHSQRADERTTARKATRVSSLSVARANLLDEGLVLRREQFFVALEVGRGGDEIVVDDVGDLLAARGDAREEGLGSRQDALCGVSAGSAFQDDCSRSRTFA